MTDSISAELLDESVEFSLEEACLACRIPEDLIVDIVAEGIVEPLGGNRAGWRFSGLAVARIQRVIRLQQEFDVNLAGAALALELLEEVARLRRARRRP